MFFRALCPCSLPGTLPDSPPSSFQRLQFISGFVIASGQSLLKPDSGFAQILWDTEPGRVHFSHGHHTWSGNDIPALGGLSVKLHRPAIIPGYAQPLLIQIPQTAGARYIAAVSSLLIIECRFFRISGNAIAIFIASACNNWLI